MKSQIAQNILTLQTNVADACKASGRKPEDVLIVLVSKTIPEIRIAEAVEAGHRVFGENRVQELVSKKKCLSSDLQWHMIGHLQTNKVKQVVGEAVLIHSLDRLDLAREIQVQAQKKNLSKVDCLIQVNTAGEATKFGLNPDAVEAFVRQLEDYPLIHVRGIMTIGPHTTDALSVRSAFRDTRLLQEHLASIYPALDFRVLSMGMSGDYRIAIEEGATLIRVGSAVFGARM